MTVKSNDPPEGTNNDKRGILKTQYDKLADDWRSFNNLIWGVPTVAIAIMTGILIGAYDRLAEGTWERIASLGIGSIFLFALTIEVIKKRYHMNVISLLLQELQIELGLKKKFRFPLGVAGDIDNYLAKFTDDDKKRMFADYKHDPLFEFFRFSYARKYLTYVIFSAATILAVLAEWEFIYHQKLGDWWTTAGTGIVVGIVAIVIPIVWYEKRKRESQQQDYEVLAHRFHIDIFQKGKLEAADEILASDFVWRNPIIPSGLQRGPESVKKMASAVIDAIPDRQITHDDTIAKGDKVMIRWTMTGTPKKELFGIPPSDIPTSIVGFDLFCISSEGKIVEMWQQFSNGKWL